MFFNRVFNSYFQLFLMMFSGGHVLRIQLIMVAQASCICIYFVCVCICTHTFTYIFCPLSYYLYLGSNLAETSVTIYHFGRKWIYIKTEHWIVEITERPTGGISVSVCVCIYNTLVYIREHGSSLALHIHCVRSLTYIIRFICIY